MPEKYGTCKKLSEKVSGLIKLFSEMPPLKLFSTLMKCVDLCAEAEYNRIVIRI